MGGRINGGMGGRVDWNAHASQTQTPLRRHRFGMVDMQAHQALPQKQGKQTKI